MAIVSFDVPDELKEAFEAAFEGQDKRVVMAALMRVAVEREQHRQGHRSAVERILASHQDAPRLTLQEFEAARQEGRP